MRLLSLTLEKASKFLGDLRGKKMSRGERAEKAITLAALLVKATHQERSALDKKKEHQLARMVADPRGRAFMTAMTDECFRSQSPNRTADQLAYLLRKYGIPRFLSFDDRLKFFLFAYFGKQFSHLSVPLIRKKIRKEMAKVLLPENPDSQKIYFQRYWNENIRINLNHLGEAILGEKEANKRLKTYANDLANPLVEYVSVKISTVFSQINMIGFEESLEVLAERLRFLYRVAKNHKFLRSDGSEMSKFVNLDMEEYKDLCLTVAVFKKVLSEPEFLYAYAGIVLQSYLPDSFGVQKELTEWAKERCKAGGAPIKIRIVKGANLAMEQVESALRSWELATFETKVQTDASFKQMLEYACESENARAVHIGVGSHNLFDISYALVLRAENEIEHAVSFEMLEGMALPMRNVVKKLSGSMLVYVPEAKEKNFHTAVAYLIRRLDENCGRENFLRHFYEMDAKKGAWREETDKFKAACLQIDSSAHSKKRKQNRFLPPKMPDLFTPFENEPDTDFSLHENREWADQIFSQWEKKVHAPIPLVIGGEEIFSLPEKGIDPSNPQVTLYHYSLADLPLLEKALEAALTAQKDWQRVSYEDRFKFLGQAAQFLREMRADLIGAMVADCGKTVAEADPEVSEAVDFLEYYRKHWKKFLTISDLKWTPKGVFLVAPPWNFPCSIPVSGIAAALTAGNCVLFKPAPETVLIGWYLVHAFWKAGIPKEVLQFINCKDEPVGSHLIKHPKISGVILTGGTETAKKFLKLKPGLDLHAETGGKNAIIVTAMSDRDLAVRDIILSAFGHSGQKCSACSLAILEAEVYDDPQFKHQLLDAASSLKVGSAWNKSSKITPLIRQPEGPLYRGLTNLEPGESWLLEPKKDKENPHLWSPGIKWNVRENDFTHQTELFGPVLAVMRAENLDEAIRLANGTPYGLTSGLHSLDEREHLKWKEKIVAGNLYINRGITGAIVRRQPFGGCKASSLGSGAKAGGPNYVHQFAHIQQDGLPHEKAPLPSSLIPLISTLELDETYQKIWKTSAENYAYWVEILKEPTDPSPLTGQDNYFYHVPLEKAYVRAENQTHRLSLLQVIAACVICKTPLEISSAFSLQLPQLLDVKIIVEDEASLFSRKPARIRLLAPASSSLKQKASETATILQDQPVLTNGRFELLNYLREVTLSYDYHRYGYLGLRDTNFAKSAR